jgi:hypothetical protein
VIPLISASQCLAVKEKQQTNKTEKKNFCGCHNVPPVQQLKIKKKHFRKKSTEFL